MLAEFPLIAVCRFAEPPLCRLDQHHNDPFDRLLVAQAVAEPLKLVTADAVLARYSDLVVLV